MSNLPPAATADANVPSTSDKPSLISLYVAGNAATFMGKTIDSAVAAWPKHFSSKLKVVQNGNEMSSAEFMKQMEAAKTGWPIISVRYKILTESAESRSVGSAEYVWIPQTSPKDNPKLDPTQGIWFDTIIMMKFGEVGTEDEEKIVEFIEVMQPVPKGRDATEPEFQSIV